MAKSYTSFVAHLLAQPATGWGRVHRGVGYALDLARHCYQELIHDRADEMASALTYRTIFSLVPIFVLSLLVLRAFVGIGDAREAMQDYVYKYLNLTALSLPEEKQSRRPATQPVMLVAATLPAGASTRPGAEVVPGTSGGAATRPNDIVSTQPATVAGANPLLEEPSTGRIVRAEDFIGELTERIYKLHFKSIGVVGFLVFIWAAISLVVTVETSFNRIFAAATGRSWTMRVMIYWAIITLGPVLMFVSLYLAGYIVTWTHGVRFIGPTLSFFSSFTALGASWLLLFLLYRLMPNAKVNVRAAAIGSFVAAVLWELGKWLFQLYVTRAVPYTGIYGSLALIPLFLFWVYLTWWNVLFGLELTYTLQAMKGRRLKHMELQQSREMPANPLLIIPIMGRIAKAFADGKPITVPELASDVQANGRAVRELVHRLTDAGLIHRIERSKDEDAGYALSTPAEHIPIARLLQLGRDLTMGEGDGGARLQQPGWAYLEKLTRCQMAFAGEATLASLLNGETPAPECAT